MRAHPLPALTLSASTQALSLTAPPTPSPADQGENNVMFVGGNSAQNTGYGCVVPAMVSAWRALWSAVPGTTPPDAPFGSVLLADGTDSGNPSNLFSIIWAQCGAHPPRVPCSPRP